jgi:hypothetical protein
VHNSTHSIRASTLAALLTIGGLMAPAAATAPAVSRLSAIGPINPQGATATGLAIRVTSPTPPPEPTPPTPNAAHFSTLPVGSVLPSDASCAASVRATPELRADNVQANNTMGVGTTDGLPRVTGNFKGTTDEIIQWTACKWGIDEDIVRAQIAKESAWHQSAKGDLTGDQSACYRPLRTGSGSCPESIGLGQVRFLYHGVAFANGNAVNSSAYNLDYTYARWRGCFEGAETWLNTVERGGQYAAGDQWGCVGLWFAGRWLTPNANTYIAAVKAYLAERVWETPGFKNW